MFNSIEFKNDSINPSFQQLEVREAIKSDVGTLPSEVILKIFYDLDRIALTSCLLVCKPWKVLASNEDLWDALMLKEIAFGKKQWQTYFGDVGEEPPLPKGIWEILKSPCPFFSGKKVKDTHGLVLIPETVDGKPLNLTALGKLVKAPKEGHATKYRYMWDEIVNDKNINQATAKSHWALMTNDVVPGTRNKSYADQQTLIAEMAKQTYEVPPLLDAAICIFMHHTGSGKRLFVDESWTYTRCQENIQNYQLAVGGFSLAGLLVSDRFDTGPIGAAALRKFF